MSWEYIRETNPRARKPHECRLCELEIVPGETYVLRTGRWDGKLVSVPMHVACERQTVDWDEYSWQTVDAAEFREIYLGEVAGCGS